MASRRIIIVSIVANVVLAMALVFLARQRLSPVSPHTVSIVTNAVTNISTTVGSGIEIAASNALPLSGFNWSTIESEDYPAYVANLRAVGCPERTISDILLPDIEELYSKKRAEVAVERDFWMNGPARVADDRKRGRMLLELDAEQAALVKQLLGVDWVSGWSSERSMRRFEFILAYLLTTSIPPEQANRLMTLIQKFEVQGRQLRDDSTDIFTPQDEAKMKELSERCRDTISRFLPAGEFQEFSQRAAAIQEHQLAGELKEVGISISADELRQIVQIKHAGQGAFGDFLSSLGNVEDLSPLSERQKEKEIRARIRTLLGETRYAKFLMATEDTFKSSQEFVREQQLPVTLVAALYEIRETASDRALEIQYDPSLTPSQRRRALKEIRVTTMTVLSQAIGDKAAEAYQKSDGSWIKNMGRN